VISDDAARLLVVLTNIPDEASQLGSQQSKRIRVLGTIEHGRKGLPIMTARSIQVNVASSSTQKYGG